MWRNKLPEVATSLVLMGLLGLRGLADAPLCNADKSEIHGTA